MAVEPSDADKTAVINDDADANRGRLDAGLERQSPRSKEAR